MPGATPPRKAPQPRGFLLFAKSFTPSHKSARFSPMHCRSHQKMGLVADMKKRHTDVPPVPPGSCHGQVQKRNIRNACSGVKVPKAQVWRCRFRSPDATMVKQSISGRRSIRMLQEGSRRSKVRLDRCSIDLAKPRQTHQYASCLSKGLVFSASCTWIAANGIQKNPDIQGRARQQGFPENWKEITTPHLLTARQPASLSVRCMLNKRTRSYRDKKAATIERR